MKRIHYSTLTLLLTLALVLAACGPEQGVATPFDDPLAPQDPLAPTPLDPVDPALGLQEEPVFTIEVTGDQQAQFGSNMADSGQLDYQEVGGVHQLMFASMDGSAIVHVRIVDDLEVGTYPVNGGALAVVDAEVAVIDTSYDIVTDGVVNIHSTNNGTTSGDFTLDLTSTDPQAGEITVVGSFDGLPVQTAEFGDPAAPGAAPGAPADPGAPGGAPADPGAGAP